MAVNQHLVLHVNAALDRLGNNEAEAFPLASTGQVPECGLYVCPHSSSVAGIGNGDGPIAHAVEQGCDATKPLTTPFEDSIPAGSSACNQVLDDGLAPCCVHAPQGQSLFLESLKLSAELFSYVTRKRLDRIECGVGGQCRGRRRSGRLCADGGCKFVRRR